MDLTPVLVCAIIFGSIYKIIELFVRRREREMLIDKITEVSSAKLDQSIIQGLSGVSSTDSYPALKWGALAIGVGIGFFLGVICNIVLADYIDTWRIEGAVYGSLIALFGGIGLIVAFYAELRLRRSSHPES